MELRIDTKRDSVEDIRKAIRFLEQFLEQQGMPRSNAPTNMFEQNIPSLASTPSIPSTQPNPNLNPLNMFDDQPSTTTPESESGDDLKIIEY